MTGTKVYFETAEIARAVGKTTEATRTWLCRHGIAKKIGGRWLVTEPALRDNLPGVLEEIVRQTAQKPTEADTP